MVDSVLLEQVDTLPAADRLDLLGRLWDSLDPEPSDHELREAQLGLAMFQADPGSARDCAEVERQLRLKYT
jgi:putative addiction module component (TIGR02574 family)